MGSSDNSSDYSTSCGLTRKALVMIAFGGVILALTLGLAIGIPLSKNKATNLDKAKEILSQVPLIDGHNDLAHLMYSETNNQLENFPLGKGTVGVYETTHTDIPRLREGRVGAQFWAAYTSCSNQYKDAVRRCLDQVDVIHRFIKQYKDTFEFVTSAKGIEDAFDAQKIGSLIGVEGGHCIDSSLATLRMLYDLGVRYLTLTHNCNTPWSDNNVVDHPTSPHPDTSDGLSDFGKDLVREMNRMGMFVDLSHVSHRTMEVALEVSQAPVIFSHSSAFALCDHRRNVQDDILQKMAKNGGVVMINFYPYFLNSTGVASLKTVADHIEYIRDKSGVDHIGIGGDFDGIEIVPEGLEDVSKYPYLFEELINRGWPDEDLKKLAGNNLLRAMREMEQVRDNLNNSPDDQILPESNIDMTCRQPYP